VSHIFIAHVEEDAVIALKIALALEEAAYKTWCYEIDTIPGQSYILRTGESVAQSEAVVVIISPHSLGSSQVTKEVVRAHESSKSFIPILVDISHAEFQLRQPEWQEAIGSAASIRIPQEGVEAIIPLITEGVSLLGIKPGPKVDDARVNRIQKTLDELNASPTGTRVKTAPVVAPAPKRAKSGKPLIISLASVAVIIILLAVLLPRLNKSGNQSPPPSTSSTTPFVSSNTPTTTAPTTPSATTPKAPVSSTTPPSSATTPVVTTPAPKPDLVIQDITWTPKSPNLGSDVTFTIVVVNKGMGESAASHVAYYIDDTFIDTLVVNFLDSGSTGKVPFTWKTESGTHKIKAVADFNNSVNESDETNNEKEINLSGVTAPDLIIQDITVTPTNPLISKDFLFTVTVKNQGNGAAGKFSIYFYINGSECSSFDISALYAGQTTTAVLQCVGYGWSWSPGGTWRSDKGTYILQATTDGGNSVMESDETNNSKSLTFTVSG
jgi:cytoskeletal protein RodZ